jgi:hypothetical protein
MSPEQVRGDPSIDHRSDLFSIGTVLYECLCGAPPFTGENDVAVMARICAVDAVSVEARRPDLPPAVAAALTRLLAKDPTARPAGAAEVAAEMGRIAAELMAAGYATGQMVRWRPSRAPALGAEQRVVSAVVVAGADDTAYGAVERTVAPFDGHLERSMGNALSVTLSGEGTPTDLATRAGRCALELRALLPRASLALVTGRAGTDALGELIATAVPLLRGEAGVIRLDEVTGGLLEARFELEHDPRGRHQLLFEHGVQEAPRNVLGRPVACVGRDRELGTLLGLWDEAVAEPAARAVLVTAPAGGGKSRVCHELTDRIARRGAPFELIAARGDAIHAAAPFGLLRAALRGAFGLTTAAGEAAAIQQQRIVAHLHRHVRVSGPVEERVAAFLGELAGVPFPDEDLPALRAARQDPRLMADQTLAAWLDFLDAECAGRPVLLVFEDLHWADAPSVRLIDEALRALADRPILVLGFARPEVDDRFHGLWRDRNLQRLALPPLTRKAAHKMVRQILADLPEERAAWIADRADGNPFYLEELLRAVGAGRDAGGTLPDTVTGMVQARFDAIGPEAKRILRAAAVFGQDFPVAGVRALLEDGEVEAWLDILVRQEVLYPRQGGAGRALGFRHALMHEAAYAMLTPADRVRGHRLAAEHLERSGEPQAIVLADHFERGGEPARAAHWCRHAVEQAFLANDLPEVLGRVDRAVRLGASGPALGAMRLVEAQARNWRGEYRQAEEAARLALEAVEPGRRFAAMTELMVALGQQARFDEVVTLSETLIAADPGEEAPEAWLGPLLRAANILFPAGLAQAAQRILARIEGRAGRRPRQAAALYGLRGRLAAAAGRLSDAAAGFRAAAAAFEEAGDARSALEFGCNVGWTMAELGQHADAEAQLGSILVQAERMNLSFVALGCLVNLAGVALCKGDLRRATDLAARSMVLARQQGDRRFLGAGAAIGAAAAQACGQTAKQEELARTALEALAVVPSTLLVGKAAMARALLAQGRLDEALAAARDAEALRASSDVHEDGEAATRLVLAETLLARGDTTAASDILDQAARRLHDRAALLAPAARDAFLSAIPDHARTLALAREHRPRSP